MLLGHVDQQVVQCEARRLLGWRYRSLNRHGGNYMRRVVVALSVVGWLPSALSVANENKRAKRNQPKTDNAREARSFSVA
jgi:hypothetical protein